MKINYLEEAFKFAKSQDPVYRIRVAAGLLLPSKNFILTSNTKKTHPFAMKYQKNQYCVHLHAETHCLVKFFQYGYDYRHLREATMYVARAIYDPDTKKFNYGLCRPCIGCQRALMDFEVKHVYYTTNEDVAQLW